MLPTCTFVYTLLCRPQLVIVHYLLQNPKDPPGYFQEKRTKQGTAALPAYYIILISVETIVFQFAYIVVLLLPNQFIIRGRVIFTYNNVITRIKYMYTLYINIIIGIYICKIWQFS